MTWATDRRLDYIDLLLLRQGRVNRENIQRAFGVSQPQASLDIQAFIAAHPGAMRYDKSAKQYEPANGRYRGLRLDAERRAALALLVGLD